MTILQLGVLRSLTLTASLVLPTGPTFGQTSNAPQPIKPEQPPRGCDTPISQRKIEAGCYTTAETQLGKLPDGQLFWHLHQYPNRQAAESARGPTGTVTESFGRHWLYTIAEENWRPSTGERIAVIGPFVVANDKPYTARYMEAVFPPGFAQPTMVGHRHPGPEAWYVLSGKQCLETPNGLIMASAGEGTMVPSPCRRTRPASQL